MKSDVSSDFELNVSPEFITEGIRDTYRQHKKSGPHTKDEKVKRQNEIYRLHFEYGYSARKIAEMMKVNRNTINSDIQYWYNRIVEKTDLADPEFWVFKKIERLEIQRTRLREMLDRADNFQQKIIIERMLFDVESKIIQTNLRVVESTSRAYNVAIKYINGWMEKNNHEDRFLKFFDTVKVSRDASEKIKTIIDQDRKKTK